MSANAEARRLVADALGQAVDDVAEDGAVGTVPGWDSLGHVRVILALEGRLGRALRSEEVAALRGVADLEALISRAGAGAASPAGDRRGSGGTDRG
jgi:acyl carrier protein